MALRTAAVKVAGSALARPAWRRHGGGMAAAWRLC